MIKIFSFVVCICVALGFLAWGSVEVVKRLDAPAEVQYPDDSNTDAMTLGMPMDPEAQRMDEVTDLARHTSDNQLEAQKDATAKIAAVSAAGYSAIMGIQAMHTAGWVATLVAICFVAWVFLKLKASKDGE